MSEALKRWMLPRTDLRPFIDRIWTLNYNSAIRFQLPQIIPGTGCEFYFNLAGQLSLGTSQLPLNHLVCVRSRPVVLTGNNIDIVAVRFKAGAFRHFSGHPYNTLFDNFFSGEELWGEKWNSWYAQFLRLNLLTKQIESIQDFFSHLLVYHYKNDQIIDEAVRRLYYRSKEIHVAELAHDLGVSRFQLTKRFQTAIGCSPKNFQTAARFQRTLKQWLMSGQNEYFTYAIENGYYDQAHFIHDVNRFTGSTPTQVFSTNKEHHFYLPSVHSEKSQLQESH